MPGVVSAAIEAARDTNIALAESVTIESGSEHEITLICESLGQPRVTQLRQKLRLAGFAIDSVRRYPPRDPKWTRRVQVQAGWLHEPDIYSAIEEFCGGNNGFGMIDLTKAVVSADTRNRMLRYVFPMKGARTISVEHRDTPGAMRSVTEVFLNHELNMLSLLLRRGGAKAGNAILIAACEPKAGVDPDDLYAKVRNEVSALPAKFMAEARVNEGLDAGATITPKEKGTVVAKVPRLLVPKVREEREGITKGSTPVFFSRRFVDDRRSEALARSVRKALSESKCHVLEAQPGEDVQESSLIFLEVSAKMWAARAGVVLVTGLNGTDALGRNLPHEFGFLQGQAKPILLLVEGGSPESLRAWSNIDGVYAPRFPPGEEAIDEASPKSVYQIVKKWGERIAEPEYAVR